MLILELSALLLCFCSAFVVVLLLLLFIASKELKLAWHVRVIFCNYLSNVYFFPFFQCCCCLVSLCFQILVLGSHLQCFLLSRIVAMYVCSILLHISLTFFDATFQLKYVQCQFVVVVAVAHAQWNSNENVYKVFQIGIYGNIN